MEKKQVIACIAAGVMMTAVLAGCQPDNTISEATTGSIKVTIVDKGYGVEWLYAIKDLYEKEYEGCTVEISETNDAAALAAKIRTNANDNDLIITCGSTSALCAEQNDGYLLDLTDVYETVQDGFDLSAKDRMNKSVRAYYESNDGKFYHVRCGCG